MCLQTTNTGPGIHENDMRNFFLLGTVGSVHHWVLCMGRPMEMQPGNFMNPGNYIDNNVQYICIFYVLTNVRKLFGFHSKVSIAVKVCAKLLK